MNTINPSNSIEPSTVEPENYPALVLDQMIEAFEDQDELKIDDGEPILVNGRMMKGEPLTIYSEDLKDVEIEGHLLQFVDRHIAYLRENSFVEPYSE